MLSHKELSLKYWKSSWEKEVGHLQSMDLAHAVISFHASYGGIICFLWHSCEITGRCMLICGSPIMIEEYSTSNIWGGPKHVSICNCRGCIYRVTTEWHFKSSYTGSASNTQDSLLPQKLLIAAVFILERVCIALTISVLLRDNNVCVWTWKLKSAS